MKPWLGVLGIILLGCHSRQSAVEVRASREFSCPVRDVRVQDLGAGGYRVWACGWFVTYTCHRGGSSMYGNNYAPGEVTCVRDSQPVPYKQ